MQIQILGIVITGNEDAHQIGSSANISCSNGLAVQTIQWLNNSNNGLELFSNSGQQQLLLRLESVSLSQANTMYTCEVILVGTGAVIHKSITLLVDSNIILTYCHHFVT